MHRHDTAPPGIRRSLEALNFFMADIQAGLGPFLGVFLLAHGWKSGLIGSVMTIGGIAGMLVTTPLGALVDGTRRKRLYIIVPCICVVLASALVLGSQAFWVVAASQVASAMASAALAPAIAGMTLGLVRQAGFNRQMGRNQAFNHAGNMVGAGLSGLLGWQFGYPAVFALAALFGVLAIVSVLTIPPAAIDDRAARGLADKDEGSAQASGLAVLLDCKPLLALAAALLLFHFGNAAMLPLYGLAVVDAEHTDGPGFVALTIVVAQAVMIVASLVAMRLAEQRGYWLVLMISFLALPLRGLIAAGCIAPWGVFPVQILDGVGAGLQSVAVPGLVARLLDGTGRINVGQGAVMTLQGIGAALSPAVGGWIAERLGYPAAFLALGGIALGSIAIWLACARMQGLRAAS
ncbi:Predicted arabinose efflux permease, MFS family [Enhydrobacter aerosaccus]|uniref:Predicted arabinose efflux permease, MFS family n=1 Tax=Enhydrobacter aerosaccus TaxID=225324 RepID=A0A1T4TFG9_9HYPH|nr:MFS transporter [Enhydrobacter aerosaccus]SKA39245.1 Predicted arabinose efflux permease, MFS family [Enhydrobacter aerosaccus]